MLEETGRIVDIEGDYAWVESMRSSACGGCTARTGCGTGAIARLFGTKRLRLRVVNRIDARIGDQVVIGIPESGVVRASFAVYMVPLGGLIGGAVIGFLAVPGMDLVAIAGAFAGLGIGLVWLRWFGGRIRQDASYQPVVLRHDLQQPTVL